jgi:protein-L-isoaspartate(D-aspartate) O-methyltransferase
MDYVAARHNMVESQIKTNNVVLEELLDALRKTPRESFVPSEFQEVAYVDNPVPLADDRYLMAPLDLARLIQEAKPSLSDLALVIGCGTGYGAAVLSKMVGAVVGLESNTAFASEATEILSGLCIETVAIVVGSLKDGYPHQAPYDIIFFEGAIPEVPEEISSQLGEGGRLVCILSGEGIDSAIVISRNCGVLSTRSVFECASPILPDFKREKVFVF